MSTIRRTAVRGSLRRKILLAVVAINILSIVVVVALFAFYENERDAKLQSIANETRRAQEDKFRRVYLSFAEQVLPEGVSIPALMRWRAWDDMRYVKILKSVPSEVFIDPKGGRDVPPELDVREVERLLTEAAERNLEKVGPLDGRCLPFQFKQDRAWGAVYLLPKPVDLPDVPGAPYASLFLTLFAGTAMLILVTYVLLNRLVLRPLDTLVRAARMLSRGDYETQVGGFGDRRDEVGRLSLAFEHLRGELAAYENDMRGRVDEALSRARASERSLEIAERLASTGKLAAGIAHEINNPLAGMLNMVRRLREGGLPDERAATYYALIEDSLKRIETTLGHFIRSSPRKAVEPKAVRIRDAIDAAATLVRHRADRGGVRLDVDVDPAVRITADAGSLQQIFLNLFLNALDAMPEGGRLDVGGRRRADSVVVTVADTGTGMTDKERGQAFDLFFTTKKQGEGTGLGLSIVHNLVRDMGGEVELASEVGVGTTFTLRFPVAGPSVDN